MNKEETIKFLEEIKKKRELIISGNIKSEKRFWERKNLEDPYWIERTIIRSLLNQAMDPINLGNDLEANITLVNTRYSGLEFVNWEQLEEVMASINITIDHERDYKNEQTILFAKFKMPKNKRTNIQVTSLDISDEIININCMTRQNDWLSLTIEAYLNYKKSEKGREETEISLAQNYYDLLTDTWKKSVEKTILPGVPCKVCLPYICPDSVLSTKYGDFNKVLKYLSKNLEESGFNMTIDNNNNYKPGNSISIGCVEANYEFSTDEGRIIKVLINNFTKE